VEPAELERALRADPALRDAAVIATTDTADERKLVAYIVLNDSDAADRPPDPVRTARERLRNHLPAYLIPDVWIVLGALPLTSNGKVDRTGGGRPLTREIA
jgi:acyl-coenzyme A synthetase/AMP-(fatty) acid ligase